MDLKDFIRDTLLDIIQGVKEAQKESLKSKAVICPGVIISDGTHYNFSFQKVQFNIILGDESSTGESKGIKVQFPQWGINIGNSKDENQKNSGQTSVSFTIPIVLPTQKK